MHMTPHTERLQTFLSPRSMKMCIVGVSASPIACSDRAMGVRTRPSPNSVIGLCELGLDLDLMQ